ncbi:unnamed protein product [Adineta steineri]|uniref:Apple domain-containing protein n=1 Tax=Adineta steineri TaxID=433720 RepID=A0A814JQ37_9BILA|nr:unnamed protein product [Adineta steineri]CAF1103792.1 unnamed protein product [Adineta steineri]
MASRRICLWLVFMIITNSVGEDTRSVLMSLITDSKFQCLNATCLPFANIITSNIMKCQMACLARTYCRAASFHQSTFNCELFTDMSNEIANMLTDTDITTMIVITGTRSPPGYALIFIVDIIVREKNRLRQQQQQQQRQQVQQHQHPQQLQQAQHQQLPQQHQQQLQQQLPPQRQQQHQQQRQQRHQQLPPQR